MTAEPDAATAGPLAGGRHVGHAALALAIAGVVLALFALAMWSLVPPDWWGLPFPANRDALHRAGGIAALVSAPILFASVIFGTVTLRRKGPLRFGLTAIVMSTLVYPIAGYAFGIAGILLYD